MYTISCYTGSSCNGISIYVYGSNDFMILKDLKEKLWKVMKLWNPHKIELQIYPRSIPFKNICIFPERWTGCKYLHDRTRYQQNISKCECCWISSFPLW